jgi:hypothetical protein
VYVEEIPHYKNNPEKNKDGISHWVALFHHRQINCNQIELKNQIQV